MKAAEFDKELLALANAQAGSILSKLGIEYSESNRWLSACCPVHGGDNRTALAFNVEKGYWKCFTQDCQEKWGSTIVGLVAGVLNYTCDDAVEWLRENVKEIGDLKIKNHKVSDKIYKEECLKLLLRTDFYVKRGFSQLTVDSFEHGKAEKGAMSHRVVFPIRDENAKIRGFSGRWTKKEEIRDGKIVCLSNTGKQVAKWRHTSFNKSDYLYNFYKAKEFCRDELILVESIGNVMRWWDCGFKNCVACLGSSLSTKQIKLIIPSTKKVLLAFDNDKAGLKALKKASKGLEEYVNIATILPPPDRDWAECSNQEVLDIYGTYINQC